MQTHGQTHHSDCSGLYYLAALNKVVSTVTFWTTAAARAIGLLASESGGQHGPAPGQGRHRTAIIRRHDCSSRPLSPDEGGVMAALGLARASEVGLSRLAARLWGSRVSGRGPGPERKDNFIQDSTHQTGKVRTSLGNRQSRPP